MPLSKDTVWLVTGCSPGGLGGSFCKTILAAGHTLVATARSSASLAYLEPSPKLLTLTLDVTKPEQIKAAFDAAITKFGHVDVVINNAGYSHGGDAEAISDEDARAVVDANFWGVVNVSKEAVRVMRECNGKRIGGLVVQVGSLGGQVAFPGNSFYHASKFAIEGFSESLSKEMPPAWNINFIILQPGGMKTEFAKSSFKITPPHPAYKDPGFPSRQLESWMLNNPEIFESVAADAKLTTEVVVNAIVTSKERPLPLRLPLGAGAFGIIRKKLESQLNDVDAWKDVTVSVMTEEQQKISEQWVQSM
ncbi:hypothetical protein BJ875DRAFT_112201 [Amylocarpus encephaloides]|uniref:NAD(P)-binding protein n=1 Tax=Amylocarpus encephaloides TaxID=45428 RepID=A0A9P7YE94_9HELO|nr:hypothetical protein BJ875DRAFT_112201 [Amylocarpus encephaloides]